LRRYARCSRRAYPLRAACHYSCACSAVDSSSPPPATTATCLPAPPPACSYCLPLLARFTALTPCCHGLRAGHRFTLRAISAFLPTLLPAYLIRALHNCHSASLGSASRLTHYTLHLARAAYHAACRLLLRAKLAAARADGSSAPCLPGGFAPAHLPRTLLRHNARLLTYTLSPLYRCALFGWHVTCRNHLLVLPA